MNNNIKALEMMIISTTLLGNDSSIEWEEDAVKVLKFIGKAFNLEKKELKELSEKIILAATTISNSEDATITLIEGVSDQGLGEVEYLKGKILLYLQSLFDRDQLHFMDYRYPNPYFPNLLFYNTSKTAKEGYILSVRELGLFYYLGIGVAPDANRAKKLLWNCVYWADEFSLYILKAIALEEKNEAEHQKLEQLISLLELGLYDGTTEINDEADYSVTVQETYKLISSIFHDIILNDDRNRHIINSSFIEVMKLSRLTYEQKMAYINEYNRGEWKNESNKITSSETNIGFLGGNK